MKRFSVVTLVLLSFLFLESAGAVIYQYADDNGNTYYTNDEATIPADKLDQAVEIEEPESAPVTTRRSYSGPTYPLLYNTQAEDRKKQQKRKEEKEQLETEYAALLKEKEAMDNDESFQKRRNKRKYQNRPYIKELVAREAEINERLQVLEGMLKAYE